MGVTELTGWLQTRAAFNEVMAQMGAFTVDSWNRHGIVPRNDQRMQVLQARIAEELRGLDDQELGEILVRWMLRADLTIFLLRTYVHGDGVQDFRRAVNAVLEHVAMEVSTAHERSMGLDA